MWYKDRQDAGQQLAEALDRYKNNDAVVLALPRGGIVLGAEVATRLKIPLGVVLVRKIGHPQNPEFALGAVAEGLPPIYSAEIGDVSQSWLSRAETAAHQLNQRRRELYFSKDFPPPEVANKIVILVDDGIATGLTMEIAIKLVRSQRAKRVVVAVPLAAADSIADLKKIADEVVVLSNPKEFLGSVGAHYSQFNQVEDSEVQAILRKVNGVASTK